MFSDSTRDALLRSGWEEDRVVDTEKFKNALESKGYPFFSCAEIFLSNFGDLEIVFVDQQDMHDNFNFSVVRAVTLSHAARVRQYSIRVGSPLVVIGTAYRDNMILLMDDKCRLYAGRDDLLIKIADSGEQAIEAICQETPFEKIP